MDHPDVQVIANLIVRREDGRVLLLHGPEEDKWWLPGGDLEAYETPAEAVRRIIGKIGRLSWTAARLRGVDSFRGRRGWHVMFHYLVEATDLQPAPEYVCDWFSPDSLPRTMHGTWEPNQVKQTLAGGNVDEVLTP
jgi:ADP-ribose pyrophosphatase YjhB (NUDIX family)